MPFCPRCREEYEAGLVRCADCGAELVEALPEEPAEDAPPAVARVLVTGPAVGEALVKLLEVQGVPAVLAREPVVWQGREVPAVEVPVAALPTVQGLLDASGRFTLVEVDEEGRGLLDFAAPGRSARERHPLTGLSPAEIRRRGPEVLPELLGLLSDPDPTVRHWALRRLLDREREGLQVLAESLPEWVRRGEREAVFAALRGLMEGAERGWEVPGPPADKLVPLLTAREGRVRALACLVLGRRGRPQDAVHLCARLLDPEAEVLEEAVEAVDWLTGLDLDLTPASSRAERLAQVERLKAWLAEHGAGPGK